MTTTEPVQVPHSDHVCAHGWCYSSTGGEHWGITYTPATSGQIITKRAYLHLTVGVGLSYDETQDVAPTVVVHISGGEHDIDADAHLRVDEAVALRNELNRYITAALNVMVAKEGTESQP